MKYFNLDYWKYLFGSYYPEYKKRPYEWPGLRTILCRIKGHPNGVVWFCNELEPYMLCKDCGEDLG